MAFKMSVLFVLAVVYTNLHAAPLALPKPATDDTLGSLIEPSAAYVHGSYGYDKRTDDTLGSLIEPSAAYVHGSYGYDKLGGGFV
ncbi:hypothetical protein GGR57DRAFT_507883 [Xylariaceae sp. FL1272]|nr:hypothetical protein GGR57DRAFT_507883 [Xylariaceae sp. FL1272]